MQQNAYPTLNTASTSFLRDCKTLGSYNPSSRTEECRGENRMYSKLNTDLNSNAADVRKTSGRCRRTNGSFYLTPCDYIFGHHLPRFLLNITIQSLFDRVTFLFDQSQLSR